MISKNCYIMGLPGTGKTTFLAALAYSLQQGCGNAKLKWTSYNGNHQHLLNLQDNWLKGYPAGRTNRDSQELNLVLELSDNDNNIYNIKFPDLSGEIFQEYYVNREVDSSNRNAICECDGIMLFINPNMIHEPILISSLSPEIRNDEIVSQEHHPINDPTEVQLVELLQFVNYLRNKPVILTVIISAWDVIEDLKVLPESYLMKQLPLLWQYLNCNKDKFISTYYGVSAQGGSLDDEKSQIEILKKYEKNQTKRITVIDNSGLMSNDISLPLWKTLCNNLR